jgi:hypothetical protein
MTVLERNAMLLDKFERELKKDYIAVDSREFSSLTPLYLR